MAKQKETPYGAWKSPVSAKSLVQDTVRLRQTHIDANHIYWEERRPSEEGRHLLVKYKKSGQIVDLTPTDFNVRSRAHEYGGGAFTIHQGIVYFSNDSDGRIYKQQSDGQPEALSVPGAYRYADPVFDKKRDKLFLVMEDHSGDGEEENCIASLSVDQLNSPEKIVRGHDFYSNPTISPNGAQIAWLAWNHPNMPWDGSELWLADLSNEGAVLNQRLVVGGASESVFQPQWSPDGILYFISDRTGWWNIYKFQNERVICLKEMKAEFGLPQWVFGMSTYAFASAEKIVCTFCEQGKWKLALLSTINSKFQALDLPFTHFDNVRACNEFALFFAGSGKTSESVVQLNLDKNDYKVLFKSSNVSFPLSLISAPEAIEFETMDGKTAHAYYYAPHNPDYTAPAAELPPLIVKSHGGPTGATECTLDLQKQFWTSRGVGILDVNYGGSTGYGREYRERLDGKWGVVDVEDCIHAARHLISQKRCDPSRIAIAGGSAGGYTTLAALTFHDFFKAGASYYGICDLEAMAKDTHKFESHYFDRLIAPYPEGKELYRERSPIHATAQLSCPVILMQGLEDKIVLPNQAEMMFKALREKGIPAAYLAFEGEQHGFRKAHNIIRSVEAELFFYAKVFRFALQDEIKPVKIENLNDDQNAA